MDCPWGCYIWYQSPRSNTGPQGPFTGVPNLWDLFMSLLFVTIKNYWTRQTLHRIPCLSFTLVWLRFNSVWLRFTSVSLHTCLSASYTSLIVIYIYDLDCCMVFGMQLRWNLQIRRVLIRTWCMWIIFSEFQIWSKHAFPLTAFDYKIADLNLFIGFHGLSLTGSMQIWSIICLFR